MLCARQFLFWGAGGYDGFCCCTGFSLVVASRLLSSCSVRASHCGGFSCCGARALGRVGFSSCGSWALEHRLIVALQHVLSSCIRESNLCLLHWQVDSSQLSHQGSPIHRLFYLPRNILIISPALSAQSLLYSGGSPALQVDSLWTEPPGKPIY